jgi:hypothetical protein
MVSPSILAACALITSSNLLTCTDRTVPVKVELFREG